MNHTDLEKYCVEAVEQGAVHARQIHPNTVITAAWVRMKCQFGCPNHGKTYCCPPHTPTPEQTRAMLDCYSRAILFHLELPNVADRRKRMKTFLEMLTDMETEVFKDGFYKAFAFVAGPCHHTTIQRKQDKLTPCTVCAITTGDPCRFGARVRPSMEACGIDVYQTARNNGFFITTLREKTETQNHYGLLLVD